MKPGSGPLQSSARAQIRALGGFQFQDFVVQFQFKKYGPEGFMDLRHVRDKGCDGAVLEDGCAIACYAPSEYSKKKYVKKIQEDHAQYFKHWNQHYPRWRVYVNHDPTPDDVTITKKFGNHVEEPWGIERLLESITALPWGKQIGLYRNLGIDNDLIGRDYIKSILDDMLKADRPKPNVSSKEIAPNIPRKIAFNVPEQHQEEFDKILQATVLAQLNVREILGAFENDEIEIVKSRVIGNYSETIGNGDFVARYMHLRQRYNDKYNPAQDDELAHNIDAIIGYMFCMCLIGKEPQQA